MRNRGRDVYSTLASFSGVWEVRERSDRDLEETNSPPQPTPHSYLPLGMTLHDWLLLIPDFDGCPDTLERFAEAVRYVAGQLGVGAQRTLLLALGRKLTHRARALFQHRLHRLPSLEAFLEALRENFGDLGAEVALFKELERARQEPGEPAGDFSARLDRIGARLCGVYEHDGASGEALRETNKALIRRAVLVGFCRGLRIAEMEVRVGVCEPRTLEEATRVAVAVENEMRWNGRMPPADGKCRRKRRC